MCGRLMPASFVVMQRPPGADGASGGVHAGGIAYCDECGLGGSGGSTACSNGVVAATATAHLPVRGILLRAMRSRRALATWVVNLVGVRGPGDGCRRLRPDAAAVPSEAGAAFRPRTVSASIWGGAGTPLGRHHPPEPPPPPLF